MPIDPSLALQVQVPNISGNFMSGMQNALAMQHQQQQMKIQQQQMGIQQQNADSLNQERQQQIAAAQRKQQLEASVDAIMKTSMTEPDPVTGVSTFDMAKFQSEMVKNNLGHAFPAYAETVAQLDKTTAELNAKRGKLFAQTLVGVQEHGNLPEIAIPAIAYLKKNKAITDETSQQVMDAISQDPSPEGIDRQMSSLGALIPQYAEARTALDTRMSAEEKRKADLAKTTAETRKSNAEADNFEKFGRSSAPEPPSLQQKDVLLDGKPAIVNYNPKTGQHMSGTEDVSARVKPIPPREPAGSTPPQAPAGDWDKTGPDFLATVPKEWRKTVEKIANYDEDPTKSVAMRGGMRDTVMRWVNQVNPDYLSDKFSIRAPTRKAFTTGTQGQQINAINTAIGHLDQLTGLADQLENGGFTPGNKAFNAISTMFGGDKVTNFDTLKDALAGEVSSVLAKGGATVSGIADAKGKISAANSPKQLAGYVQTLIPVLGSKLVALDAQYKQAMGENDSFSALSDQSKGILSKMGFDPSHPTIASGGAPTATPSSAPQVGERRMINGRQGEWDGKGWKAVQ